MVGERKTNEKRKAEKDKELHMERKDRRMERGRREASRYVDKHID
jgi:hypothetical protein